MVSQALAPILLPSPQTSRLARKRAVSGRETADAAARTCRDFAAWERLSLIISKATVGVPAVCAVT